MAQFFTRVSFDLDDEAGGLQSAPPGSSFRFCLFSTSFRFWTASMSASPSCR